MCRSTTQGGRRCHGTHTTTPTPTTSGTAAGPVAATPDPGPAPRYAPGELEAIRKARGAAEKARAAERDAAYAVEAAGHGLARLTRRAFLQTPVTDLAKVDGDTVWVSPRPKGMSEQAYRDHLASGPRMNVRVRPADTEGLPERLWGGSMARGCDPESARVIANTARKRGELVSVEWTDPPARKPLSAKEGRQVATDAWRLDRLAGDLTEAQRTGDAAGVLRARYEMDRLNTQIAAGYGDGTTQGTR